MPKIIKRKAKTNSYGKRKSSSTSKVNDMTKREYNLRKAEIGSRNKQMRYDYKTASRGTRAAVQKSTVRSAAGSSMVASGSNSAAETARAESEAYRTKPFYYNRDSDIENTQQDGGIGGGGSSYGYKGQDDDF